MTFGFKINTNSGSRLLDETYPVPEFVGKVVLNNTAETVYKQGSVPYTLRRYRCTIPNTGGREYMVAWALPDYGGDVWLTPYQDGVIDMFVRDGYGPIALPEGYVFANGATASGSSSMGVRLWDASGRLILDTGNKQLSITSIITGVNMNENRTNAYGFAAPSSKPAFILPVSFRVHDYQNPSSEFGDDASSEYFEYRGGYRRSGATLYANYLQTAYFYTQGGNSSNALYDDVAYGNFTNLSVPVINASLYD